MTVGSDAPPNTLGTKVAAGAAGLLLLISILGVGAAAGIASFLGSGSTVPSTTATTDIPPAVLALYQQAATSCPGLPWTVLAAIGTVESDNGQSTLPGVHSGANSVGAEGPMQFEPATFAEYTTPIPPGGANPASPYDLVDAVYAAARDLCANGGKNGADLTGAVFAYDHSDSYVAQVLTLAQTYGETQAQVVTAGAAGGVAVDWALAQVGTPYKWGGETPGVGFDCSGLVQAAYEVAGISLPRTAQDQYDDTTHLEPGDPVEPGDLIFFGTGSSEVTHVGIYIGNNQMVDAPHTGADVRVEAAPTRQGVRWSDDVVIGVTDPAIS